jgi:ribosomal protein S18 acetylase RimI-like enzyme
MSDPFAVIEATWPAAALHRAGPWLLREGRGGGKRVSATTAAGDWQDADIALAEAAQASLGQDLLFMLRPDEAALDATLEAQGYRIVDPVVILAGPVAALTDPPPPMTTFPIWPPLAIMRDIWAEGGVGAGRIAVMERVTAPKTAILGRINDRAAGTAFVALHDKTAMLHALHVLPGQRRQGIAAHMMQAAALWAQDQGAERFSVVVTAANAAALALYASLGMAIVGHYHYRMR